MTANTLSDNTKNEKPSVRTAWDAVKSEITSMATNAFTMGLFTAASLLHIKAFHVLPALLPALPAMTLGLAGFFSLTTGIHGIMIARKLKNIPTNTLSDKPKNEKPSVRTAWDAVKSEVTMMALKAVPMGLFAAACLLQIKAFRVLPVPPPILPAIAFGIASGCFGLATGIHGMMIARKLKNIPAPRP
jgi:hypothetical protein